MKNFLFFWYWSCFNRSNLWQLGSKFQRNSQNVGRRSEPSN